MNEKTGPSHVVDLTPGRRVWVNTLDLSWPAHSMYGLLEVDVTVSRQVIAEHEARTGETLSSPASWPTAWPARWMRTRRSKLTGRATDDSSCLTM